MNISQYNELHLLPKLITLYAVGRGVNGEGFKFKLDMVKMCSTWPLLNKLFEVDLQTPSLPQTSYMAYGNGQKLKIWILLLPWSKCIHNNPKGIFIPFKQKLNTIYRPHDHVLGPKWLFWSKMLIFVTFGSCGVHKTLQSFH